MRILSGLILLLVLAPSAIAAESSGPVAPHIAMGKVVLALVFITFLIVGFAWLAKRSGLSSLVSNKKIQVIASTPLGGREKAVLVKVGETHLLLGVSPGRVSSLHAFTADELPDEEKSQSQDINQDSADKSMDFSSHLKNILAFGKQNETS